MAKAKEFSTILKEEAIVLIGKNDERKEYLIKELTGGQRQEYQEQFDVQISLGDDNKPTMTTGKDFKMWTDIEYLSRCLYEKDKEEPVGEDFVAVLPGNVVKDITEEARKLSGLDTDSLQKAKNALEAKDSNG